MLLVYALAGVAGKVGTAEAARTVSHAPCFRFCSEVTPTCSSFEPLRLSARSPPSVSGTTTLDPIPNGPYA